MVISNIWRQYIGSWAALFGSLLLLCAAIAPASAHFLLNLNVRIFHVEHLQDGVRVYFRTPMPYLVANRVGPIGDDGLPTAAPFTSNRIEDGRLVHYVDPAQLRLNPIGLGELAADGLQFGADGTRLKAIVEQVRIHRVGSQPGFATLAEAKAVFASDGDVSILDTPLYVGDTVVDIIMRYKPGAPIYDYSVSSTLNPGLPGQDNTANLILDYRPGGTKVFRARGLLSEPISISRSALSAVVTFIKEGVRHILEGLDHVLFVLCLVLGAPALRSLVWRITGFTIGHSVTLTAGFFGFVPQGAWFVPTVETGIALSIVYAAIIAVLPQQRATSRELSMFVVTCGIGLLHGLGFSFVLHEILQVTAPDIWKSLLAFNVGVEIGQLAIVLATWPLFRLTERLSLTSWQYLRGAVAFACAAAALFWTGERMLSIMQSLSVS